VHSGVQHSCKKGKDGIPGKKEMDSIRGARMNMCAHTLQPNTVCKKTSVM